MSQVKELRKCDYCGKSWVTNNTGYSTHVKHCHFNPECIPAKTHLHTAETKLRISESRKRYIEEHPDQVPFKLNHASKKSYPEEYFEELFIKENIPLQYHLQVSRYELGFYNKNLMKYVEIDGEQHFSEYMIKHDKEREEFLSQLGWVGYRVRWSEYKSLSDEEKKVVIDGIRSFMSSASSIQPVIHYKYKSSLKEDRDLKLKLAKENGTLDSIGRVSNRKLSISDIENRKQLILNSGIDLTKFGWVNKVVKVTGLSKREIYFTVEHCKDLKEVVFRKHLGA